MSTNPRLTIELVDKGGTASPSYPGSPPSSNVPYDANADAQRNLTTNGIQIPQATTLPTVNPVGDALAVQNAPSLYGPGAVGFQNAPKPDLMTVAQKMLGDNPGISAKNLADLTGIKQDVAVDLIAKAQSNTQPQQPSLPQTQSVPAIDRFAERVKESLLTEQEKHDRYVAGLDNSLKQGSLNQDQFDKAAAVARDSLQQYKDSLVTPPPVSAQQEFVERAKRAQEAAPEARLTRDTEAARKAVDENKISAEDAHKYLSTTYANISKKGQRDNVDNISASQVGHALNNLASATGLSSLPSGGVLQSALGVLPATTQMLGATSLSAMLLGGAGIVGAAAGTASASIYAALNEAERGAAISRPFSPEVAIADAVSELRRIQADMRTAAKLGDESAEYINQRSRLSASAQGIRDTFAEPIIADLARSMDNLADILNATNNFLTKSGLDKLFTYLVSIYGPGTTLDNLRRALQQITPASWWEEANLEGSPTAWFDNNFPHLPLPSPFIETNEKPIGVVDGAGIPALGLN